MQIDPDDLTPRERYRLLIACVIPRPICWISTRSAAGIDNLAPFSFFGGVTSDPPMVMVSVGRRRGVAKDTADNLVATAEGVVHIPHRELAEAMVATSAELPPEQSEAQAGGLELVACVDVEPRRLAASPIAMEARVTQHLELGAGPVDVFFLQVVRFHLHDEVLDDRGLPDASRLAAVGRLGGTGYCDTGEPFEVTRPG